jgi:hypothetical protein
MIIGWEKHLTEKKHQIIPLLPIAGALLILLNIFLTALTGNCLMISNGAANSVEDLTNESAPLWGRIAFGQADCAYGILPAIGIVLAALIIYSSLILYTKPRFEKILSITIMIFSAVALLYGGGFIIGSVLAFIGGAFVYHTPLEPSKSLVGRLLSSLMGSSKAFKQLAEEAHVKDAATAVLFVNLLSGIGSGLYGFNANGLINTLSTNNAFEILLKGRIGIDVAILQVPITLMGLGVIKWMMLSLLIFLIGVKFFRGKTSLASIATVTGFAYAPISLQFFTPFIFTSTPYLMMWPMAVFAITHLWMVIVLTLGMKETLRIPFTESLALITLCGATYLLIHYVVFTPMNIAYVPKFQIQPPEIMLMIISTLVIVGLFFIGSKEKS